MANLSPAVLSANTKIVVNSVDLSYALNQVKLNFKQAALEVSTFGAVWKQFIVGLAEGVLEITGFFDKAPAKLDAMLWAWLGWPQVPQAWEVDLPDSTVGSVRYTGQAFVSSYPIDSKVDQPLKVSLTLQVTLVPTRAIIIS